MKISRLLAVALIGAIVPGCDRTEDNDAVYGTGSTFVLNNGKWGDNNANIGIYDPQTRTFVPDAFLSQNGLMLGDLAQDIMRVEDEVYIAVNGSRTVFVTDNSLKIKRQLNAESGGNRLSPRYMTSGGGKVYVTYYEGYLGEIDPSRDYSIRVTKVGRSPEGLAYSDGHIYVANSGGADYPDYDRTVSVVDAASFCEVSKIDVNVNPELVFADKSGRYVFVSSIGDYAGNPAMLQRIDLNDGSVADLDYNISKMHYNPDTDMLYILAGEYDSSWNLNGKIYLHNVATDNAEGEFIKDGTTIPNAYSISAAADGYVYVGTSDYISTGDMYVFKPDGTLHDRFDTNGLNPIKAL